MEEFEAYAEDYAFMTEFNKTCRDPKAIDDWITEWVLDCQSFEAYKAKLGSDRILYLKGNADRDAWRYRLEALEGKISEDEECNATETMVVVAAREIKERISRNQYKAVLAGAGTANLAAWVAKYHLQNEGYEAELMVELGYYGNAPRPSEPFVLNFGNFPTCKILTETIDTLGVFTSGATNRSIGVLGGGQVDRFGNINSTRISQELYLTGSGGANDVASGAREVVVVMQQSKRRFLEKVPYITAPGIRVKTLVSTMGVFQKLGDDDEFTLTKTIADPSFSSKEEIVRAIQENCGWNIRVARDLEEVPLPTVEELRLLRVFDPNRYYLK